MPESPIILRLNKLRRMVRRRLVLYGLFAVLAGGVASFLTVVSVDWLVALPPLLRMFSAALFFAGFVGAVMHWIVAPLRAQLDISKLAGKVEQHFQPLQDRLASSVNFLQRGDAEASTMARRVVESTERALGDYRIESSLTAAPLAWRAGLFCASMVALSLIGWSAPDWVRTGLYRYIYPWGEIEWPRSVSILPMTAGQTVAMGEAAVVRMEVRRGMHESLRAIVRLREQDGTVNSLALRNDGDGVFSATIESVTADLTYWFEAGDDSTARNPASIRVVRRPEVIEALATIEPPPYATARPSRVADFRDGPIIVTFGGFVTVSLRTSKPISADATQSSLGLRLESGDFMPLEVDPDDPFKMATRFEVTDDLEFRPELRDEYGFENRGAPLYVVQGVPDAAPTVSIVEPPSSLEVTPRGSVQLLVRAEDDFGIERMDLVAELPSKPEPVIIPLSEAMRIDDSGSDQQAVVRHSWNLAELNLSPGDMVIYSARATDNHRDGDVHGHDSRSAPMRLKVISEADLESRIREDLTTLEDRVRRMMLEQSDLQDRTRQLLMTEDAAQALSETQRDAAAGLSVSQLRLARQLRETAARFDELGRRLEENLGGAADDGARVGALAETVRAVALGPATAAGTSLGQTRDMNEPAAEQDRVAEALLSQDAVIEQLQDALRSMNRWGNFQSLVARTRDFLDRQTDILARTTELGRATLGKSSDALEPAQRDELRRTQRSQEQLADDVGEHLARLEQLRDASRDKDASTADAIDATLRSARADDIIRKLREAAQAVGENRTTAANDAQKATEAALRRMLDSLRERETRELARLRKQIDDAAKQVKALIDEQQTIRASTEAATTENVELSMLDAAAGLQRTLARNARLLGEELMDGEQTLEAGRLVRQSSTPMTKAEAELLAKNPPAATAFQDEAIKSLTEAHDSLLAAEQQTAEALLRKTLDEIRDDLQVMLAAQQKINAGVIDLKASMDKIGRLGRAETREASRLAREQMEARNSVDRVLPDFEQVAVFRWALERVGRWMEETRSALDERRVDESLLSTTERIAAELQKLIAAIAQTESMPLDTEFAEAESGGGGGAGASASTAPVPTVAELLVLKTMQNDINDRTAALYARFDVQHPSEKDLRQLSMIGEDQIEVRRLTEMVTSRAKGR